MSVVAYAFNVVVADINADVVAIYDNVLVLLSRLFFFGLDNSGDTAATDYFVLCIRLFLRISLLATSVEFDG